MNISAETSLGDLVTTHPTATRVLMRHGLDFCCGGQTPLARACAEAGLAIDDVVAELSADLAGCEERNWGEAPVADLIQHLLDVYHAPIPEEVEQIQGMANRVLKVHGAKDPERLEALAHTFAQLAAELSPHLVKEEQILFPWILGGHMPPPTQPIVVMRYEHDDVGVMLGRLHTLTDGYTPPEGACGTWRALYARLEVFDRELRMHIHLENNVLFPRALNDRQGGSEMA
jgi:regulator of cell morphogenesis and NO signaling